MVGWTSTSGPITSEPDVSAAAVEYMILANRRVNITDLSPALETTPPQ